ncbi:hypothetical protein HDC92_004304 [Pedobacter sp. AK017]|uniref:hypothetical protein n=1 Tax=Pedobacter sp. AK017 TaxID=2723073 RepID=UPI00161DE4C1|nr:hypothetical protein [Pedobacter sp. AK017]MBB5440601.1 hypothetical protein [Pedobacter sp. AK017]
METELVNYCYVIMETFEIQLLADRFQIEPLENGLYRIMEGEHKVGVIFPEPDGDQVKWATQDELDEGFVQQIGELITEHNM